MEKYCDIHFCVDNSAVIASQYCGWGAKPGNLITPNIQQHAFCWLNIPLIESVWTGHMGYSVPDTW